MKNLKFDCIDFNEKAPEGLAFAYGWDKITGAAYRGLVEVDLNGVIGEPIWWVTIPYYFDVTDKPHAEFKKLSFEKVVKKLKLAV